MEKQEIRELQTTYIARIYIYNILFVILVDINDNTLDGGEPRSMSAVTAAETQR